MKVTLIAIVIGMLGGIPKHLMKGLKDLGIRERAENIQSTALPR